MSVPWWCRILITGVIISAGFVVVFTDNDDFSTINVKDDLSRLVGRRRRNATIKTNSSVGGPNIVRQSIPVTTDFFVVLPGKEMDSRNQNLFDTTRSSVLKFYPEEFLHVVYNTGDPSYLRRFNETEREDHIVQSNNRGLGGFAAAAEWMERNRPAGNFVMLQHSASLVAEAAPPACDVELVNLRQRCGGPCRVPTQNMEMLTGMGTQACFPILNEMMDIYNVTCGFPCCKFDHPGDIHLDYWPLMAHNNVLITPLAREFMRPMIEHIRSLPAGHILKNGDQGTERLFGLFSTMLLQKHGAIHDKNVTFNGKNYSDPLDALNNKVFVCSQDLTVKTHGNLGRKL